MKRGEGEKGCFVTLLGVFCDIVGVFCKQNWGCFVTLLGVFCEGDKIGERIHFVVG